MFGNRGGSAVMGQNMLQQDSRGLPERIIPFLPAWAASGALWPAGALTHAMWGTDPAALPWATAGLTLITAGLTALTAKVAKGGNGYRAHSVVSVAGSSAWLTAATIVGPGTHPLLDMWLMGAPALAVSWNVRRVLKIAGGKDGEASKSENQLFKAVKLAGTTIRGELTVAPNKVQVPLQLPAGEMTADDVAAAKGRLASALSVPKNAVRVIPDPEHHDRAELVVVPHNMLKESTPWPGPSAPGGSMMDPINVGVYEDGERMILWLPGEKREGQTPRNASHGMAMGMNGSGKSHGAKIVWTEILTRYDGNLWVGDPVKGRQTLGPFLDKVHWAATTQEECEAMVACLPQVITARTNYLADKGLDQWVPDCGLQYLTVWLEEAPRLLRDSDDLVDLVQTARSAGVSIVLSLQRASFDQMPTSVRAQLGIRWCFGVDKDREAEFCLSEDTIDAGANPGSWKNKRPGCNYLEAPDVDEDRYSTPGRTYATKDADMVAAIDAVGGPAPHCEVTAAAAGSAYPSRRPQPTVTAETLEETPSDAPGDDETLSEGHYTGDLEFIHKDGYQVPKNHEPELDNVDADTELEPLTESQDLPRLEIGPDEAMQLLRRAVANHRAAGNEYIGPKDMPDGFTTHVRSRPWVSAALGRLADLGELVETNTPGRYAYPPALDDAA